MRESCLGSNNMKKCLKQGVRHIVALPFTLKRILKQKKNYENSNISPYKHLIFKKKNSKREQNLQK
jgi:hypothetical protein